jgi:hypothetical protein
MTFLSVILLFTSASAVADQPSKPNLLPITISFAAPPTFEICKLIDPANAHNYDRELRFWHSRNDPDIEKLKVILAKQMEQDGRSELDHLREIAASGVDKFKKLSIDQQLVGCKNMYLYVGNN